MPRALKNSRILAAVERGAAKGKSQATRRSKVSKMSSASKNNSGLDAAAQAHAQLLMDPCFGRLAHPVYNTADGGCLSRFESEFTVATSAGLTGAVIAFVPGGLARSVFGNVTGIVSDTTATLLANTSSPIYSPGYAFLQSTASAVRPVAACMQVCWPGAELARQGFVALGQCTGGVVTQALSSNITVSSLRPLAHMRSRMPENVIEVKWRPQAGDADWTDPNTATPDGDLQKKGAVFCAISNLPADLTGARIRLVCVYEWQPRSAQGMASNADDRARSRNTLTDVINALDKNGPDWAYAAGRATTMYGAYMTGRNAMVRG